MVDIARDARWGRVAEGFGEDPYLAGALAAAMVRGYQTNSLRSPDAMAACVKHFAGYGAVEAGREYNSAWIPDNLLRDVYLPPFRAALDAGAATVMAGFQALNGVPATGNRFLLRDILRGEWNFQGMVVSDYTAVPEMVQHGFASDDADAARKAIDAGIDMEMVSTTYFDHVKMLLETGEVDMRHIDEAVRNILRLKFELGLFDADDAPGTVRMRARFTATYRRDSLISFRKWRSSNRPSSASTPPSMETTAPCPISTDGCEVMTAMPLPAYRRVPRLLILMPVSRCDVCG